MSNKPVRLVQSVIVACSLLTLLLPAQAADILTLFTTPQERQLINSNRYKTETPEEVMPAQVESAPPEEIQTPYTEEVTREYRVSGVTLSQDGINVIWVNGQAIEEGDKTSDGSRVQVVTGQQLRILFITPDGSRFEGEVGDTVEVVYQVPVQG